MAPRVSAYCPYQHIRNPTTGVLLIFFGIQ
jgi:hypothetical protein